MKFTIEKEALEPALAKISRIVVQKSGIPILANVLIETTEGGVILKGTDLDCELSIHLAADVQQQGRVTADAKQAAVILAKLSYDALVSVSLKDETLIITAARSRFALKTINPADFPDISHMNDAVAFKTRGDILCSLLGNVKDAVSTKETRYDINGIYLATVEDSSGRYIRAVALDGNHLLLMQIGSDFDCFPDFEGVIFPRKAYEQIINLLQNHAGDVNVFISRNKLKIEVKGAFTFIAKYIDGMFPDYERVIPRNSHIRFEAPRQALTDALDRVATVAENKLNSIKLELIENNLLRLSAESRVGVASEDLGVKYEGDAAHIGLNARYLSKTLALYNTDTVIFELGSPDTAIIVKPSHGGESFFSVIMPLLII